MARHNMIFGTTNYTKAQSLYILILFYLFYSFFLIFFLFYLIFFLSVFFGFFLDFQSTPGRGLSSGSIGSGPGGQEDFGTGLRPPGGVGGGAHFVHPACTKLCARVRKFANFANLGGGGGTPPGGPKNPVFGGRGRFGGNRPGSGVKFGHKAKQSRFCSFLPR